MKMKKTILMIMTVVLLAGAVHAIDLSASVDFASAYVFRGVTLNNGLVVQPGAEISGFLLPEECGSLAVGIWANYDIDDEDGDGSDFSEIDYYLSYSLPIEALDVSVSYAEYDYPGGEPAEKEVALSLGKALGDTDLYGSFTANYGVGGAIDKSWYLQVALDYEKELSEKLTGSLGATVAYAWIDEGSDGFSDATASVGLGYALNDNWSLNGSVMYVAQLDDDVLSDAAYDVDVVASIGISYGF